MLEGLICKLFDQLPPLSIFGAVLERYWPVSGGGWSGPSVLEKHTPFKTFLLGKRPFCRIQELSKFLMDVPNSTRFA